VAAVDGAVEILNQQIRNIAATSDRIAVADYSGLIDTIFAARKFKVGNVQIDHDSASNDPASLVLADGLHPGTIGQGLLGNLLVETANGAFHTRITPLS